MRWRRTVRERMAQHLVQLGLNNCPVCSSQRLFVGKYPAFVRTGGLHQEPIHPRYDADAGVLMMFAVECDTCGHVLFFDSGKFAPGEEGILVPHEMSEEEENRREAAGQND